MFFWLQLECLTIGQNKLSEAHSLERLVLPTCFRDPVLAVGQTCQLQPIGMFFPHQIRALKDTCLGMLSLSDSQTVQLITIGTFEHKQNGTL